MNTETQPTPADVILFLITVTALVMTVLAYGGLKWRRSRVRRPKSGQNAHLSFKAASRPVQTLTEAYMCGHLTDRELALALLEELETKDAELAALKATIQPTTITEDSERWLEMLLAALHLLCIGHTGGGKTTLVHWLVTRRAQAGERVIVCDPDAAPGLWPACEVYGYGNDFPAINRALGEVAREVEQRRKLRGSGRQRLFTPLHLVIDEYQDTTADCPLAQELVEDVLRRGRKLGVHLIIGVQDKLVKTMGFEGKGDLRKNFSYVVELRKDRDGQRWATLTATGDAGGITFCVPVLPDPELLVQHMPELSKLSGNEQTGGTGCVKIEENHHLCLRGMVGKTSTAYNDAVKRHTAVGMQTDEYRPQPIDGRPLEEKVKDLHAQGKSPTEIAMKSGWFRGAKGKRLAQVKAILGVDGSSTG